MNLHRCVLPFVSSACLLAGCGPSSEHAAIKVLPDIYSATNVPGLQKYVLEFSRVGSRPREPMEPSLPFTEDMIRGRIDSLDHNPKCSLWLVRSHAGSGFYDGQRLYLYSYAKFSESTPNWPTRWPGNTRLGRCGAKPLL